MKHQFIGSPQGRQLAKFGKYHGKNNRKDCFSSKKPIENRLIPKEINTSAPNSRVKMANKCVKSDDKQADWRINASNWSLTSPDVVQKSDRISCIDMGLTCQIPFSEYKKSKEYIPSKNLTDS